MKKSPKYDPQREEVYRWERKFGATTYGDCGTRNFYALRNRVCEKWKVPKPVMGRLQSDEHRYAAVCDPNTKSLRFNPGYCTASILLHELAHWVLDRYGFKGSAHHNFLWLGVYLRMMHDHKVLPLDASVPSARKAGLKFADPKKCTLKSVRLLIERANELNHPAS